MFIFRAFLPDKTMQNNGSLSFACLEIRRSRSDLRAFLAAKTKALISNSDLRIERRDRAERR